MQEVRAMFKTCKEIGPRINLTVNKKYEVLETKINKYFGKLFIVLNDNGDRQAYVSERFN
jgi:hypothetical protein